MEYLVMNGELYHHGIKGQKWGVRRFQNEDGSLTNAGKKRYTGNELASMAKQVQEYHKGKSSIQMKKFSEIGKTGAWYDNESRKLVSKKDSLSKKEYEKAFDNLGKELDRRYKEHDKKEAESIKNLTNNLNIKYGIDLNTSMKEIQRNPIKTALALAGEKRANNIVQKYRSSNFVDPNPRRPRGIEKTDGPSKPQYTKVGGVILTDGSDDYKPKRPKNVLY